jgi:hypothetical protein
MAGLLVGQDSSFHGMAYPCFLVVCLVAVTLALSVALDISTARPGSTNPLSLSQQHSIQHGEGLHATDDCQ